MLQKRLWRKVSFFVSVLCISFFSYALAENLPQDNSFYLDKVKLVSQQIDLLKNRLVQAKNELSDLEHDQNSSLLTRSLDHVNKERLNRAALDVQVANSNLESIQIELSESQQTVYRLEKETQEIENQLNVLKAFRKKIASNSATNIAVLQSDLIYQKNLLTLEKSRADYLKKLEMISESSLQLYQLNYDRMDQLLKSYTMMRLREEQARSEVNFQMRQSYWLGELNRLYAELASVDHAKMIDRVKHEKLEHKIFYANENVNFIYLQMLITRYQDQIQQLKLSVSRGNSISLLNKISDQLQNLSKQVTKVDDLLKTRVDILKKRRVFLIQDQDNYQNDIASLAHLEDQYQSALSQVALLTEAVSKFRSTLDHALQQELSSRQGLPGFSAKAWFDLGEEILLVPSLTFQAFKTLSFDLKEAFALVTPRWWMMLSGLECVWIGLFCIVGIYLRKLVTGMPDHEFGHINLKWLTIRLVRRHLVDIALIGNVYGLFALLGIAKQHYNFLVNLGWVWLTFSVFLKMARLCLMETVQDHAGHDVQLYHRLRWSFVLGGVVTAMTVFIHELPLVYEVKDLFDRLFLSFLLLVSIFLLRSWKVVPNLILAYIDDRRMYLKGVIRLIGLLIPLTLFFNSIIGLLGYVNLVLTISHYECIFLFVLAGYLVLRGLVHDAMCRLSDVFIAHVSNGWLWTEAVLKPLDHVLRLLLFVAAWAVLFLLYGWDPQSPVVERFNSLLHYRLIDILNTTITPISIIEASLMVSFLYWAARWTREFVYRILTNVMDQGVRNSVAILSQYAVIVSGVLLCLKILGIDLHALTFVATGFAFAVGLGLRDLANNFACGFLLLFERPLRVGDTVTLNGYEGDVIHIGGRAVTIRTWDHMEVIVPNSEVFGKSFVNWTAKDNIVRTVIAIKINRHDRPQDVQTIMHQVLSEQKDILREPPPEVFLKELADGLIEFEVRYYINLRKVKSRLGVRSDVLTAIWEAFEVNNIHPPYPHHEIYLKGGVPVEGLLGG